MFAAAVLSMLVAEAHAAHPLLTEDTGTQGRGGWQLELNGERSRDTLDGVNQRATQAAATLSYGAADNVDLQLSLPRLRQSSENGVVEGSLDTALDLKWRVFERGALSFGLKPGITLPTGRDELGLGTGRTTLGGLAILSWEPEGRFVVHSHAGYRHNRNTLGQRVSLWHLSAALLYKATERLRLLVDHAIDTNPDPTSRTRLRQTVLGAIYSVSKDLDLDAGVRRGNEPALDRALLLGVTLRW